VGIGARQQVFQSGSNEFGSAGGVHPAIASLHSASTAWRRSIDLCVLASPGSSGWSSSIRQMPSAVCSMKRR